MSIRSIYNKFMNQINELDINQILIPKSEELTYLKNPIKNMIR